AIPPAWLITADLLSGPDSALCALWRPGKPGVDVQRRKPLTRHRLVPESQRTDSRRSHLDNSRFGNLVLVRVAQWQHAVVIHTGPRGRSDCGNDRAASRAHGPDRVALRVGVVSVHATGFTYSHVTGFER